MNREPAIVIVGCAIVSADGMLADSSHIMPVSLKFDADQTFFNDTLERADLIVHGRNSYEDQPNSLKRRRIILTRRIAALDADPHNPNATLWNPAGASFEDACARAGVKTGRIAIIGGTDVFGMFLDRYDTFFLSRAPNVRLPGGVPVFPGVPGDAPQDIMARHGLRPDTTQTLDAANGVTLTPWLRRTS